MAVVVVCLLLAGSANAASTGATLKWKAPYTGTTHKAKTVEASGCVDYSDAGPKFSLANGALVGAGSATASNCSTTIGGSSEVYISENASVGLPTFTGHSGIFVVTAKFKLSFKIELSMSGTTCGQGGQLDEATVIVAEGVWNETSGQFEATAGKAYDKQLSGAGSLDASFTSTITLSIRLLLDGKASYQVYAGGGFSVEVDVYNPTTVSKADCTATADVLDLDGSNLATLTQVVVR